MITNYMRRLLTALINIHWGNHAAVKALRKLKDEVEEDEHEEVEEDESTLICSGCGVLRYFCHCSKTVKLLAYDFWCHGKVSEDEAELALIGLNKQEPEPELPVELHFPLDLSTAEKLNHFTFGRVKPDYSAQAREVIAQYPRCKYCDYPLGLGISNSHFCTGSTD